MVPRTISEVVVPFELFADAVDFGDVEEPHAAKATDSRPRAIALSSGRLALALLISIRSFHYLDCDNWYYVG